MQIQLNPISFPYCVERQMLLIDVAPSIIYADSLSIESFKTLVSVLKKDSSNSNGKFIIILLGKKWTF